MRPIHLADLDKRRPVLVLTREVARPHLRNVTVVAITSTIRGMAVEVPLGPANGLEQDCVANLDDVQTIPVDDVFEQIGWLLPAQEAALTDAIQAAYDFEDPEH
jgi:mRNA interferase MazF